MTPSLHDELDDRLPSSDHDLLIRVHERLTSLQQTLLAQNSTNAEFRKELDDLKEWRNTLKGQQMVMARTAGFLGGIVSAVVSSILIWLLTP